jgi:DNA-binding transcriptional MerR regulator
MREAGVGRNTLRFYEREGLIAKPNRTATGYRSFARETLADLEFIKQAKSAGLLLGEIKELLQLSRADQATCGKISQQIEGKISDIDAAMTQLERKKAFLAEFLGACKQRQPSARCDVRRKGFKESACCG